MAITISSDPSIVFGPTIRLDSKPPMSSHEQRIRNWLKTNERRFSAEKKPSGELEIVIMDVIGDFGFYEGVSAKSVKQQLDAAPDVNLIRVLLNTPGGDVYDGVAIQSLLKRHKARVEMEVLGESASAGTIIMMAGDHIAVHEGSMVMVHKAWRIAMGNADDLRRDADTLEKIDNSIMDLYVRRTGKEREDLQKLVENEGTYMTAAEAVEQGLADEVLVGKQPASAANKEVAAVKNNDSGSNELQSLLESDDPRVRELAREELIGAELNDFKGTDSVELSREDLVELALSEDSAVSQRALNQLRQRPRAGLAAYRTQPARRAADYREQKVIS